MCTVLAYESVRGSCSAYKRKRSLGLRNTVEWEEFFFLYMKQVILYVHEGAVTSWREENIVTCSGHENSNKSTRMYVY